MKVIELRSRGNGIAHLVLGITAIVGAYLLWTSSINLETLAIFCLAVGILGLAFIFLGLKVLQHRPLSIKYGNGEIWLPENVASKNYLKIKLHEVQEVIIRSHVPKYVKTLEVSSEHGKSSISLEAIPKNQLGELLNYLGAPQC